MLNSDVSTTALNDMARQEAKEQQQLPNTNEKLQNKKEQIVSFDPVAFKYIGKRVDPRIQKKYTKTGENYNLCFKMVKCDSKLVKSLLFSYGFIQCSNKNQKCNLLWTNTHLSPHSMRELRQWQRINHFPRSWMLTKKDMLYENVNRMAIYYGREWFNFIPDFFCTPMSKESIEKLRESCEEIEKNEAVPFIVKPAGGSYGRGIFFLYKIEQISAIDNTQRMIISRYIDRPYLINGLKWDLRIYVLITSYYPLIAYVYRNTDCTAENIGHKWTLGAVLRELEKRGVDTELLMVRIEDIVIKSLLSIQAKVAAMCRKLNLHPKCCFELFGFDILVDEDLKPWVLEVNLSPSLICDSPLDSLLKSHLLANVLNVAQIPLVCDKNMQNMCFDAENENNQQGDAIPMELDEHEKLQELTSCCSSSSPLSQTNSDSSIYFSRDGKHGDGESRNGALSAAGKNEGKFSTMSLPRATKVRRAQLTQKVSYSADRITSHYIERVKCLFEKLKSEEKRKGHFNRIFPRQNTWQIYSSILEDCGQERWDEALNAKMISENYIREQELSRNDIQLAHEQLINAGKFKHRNQLDPLVRDAVLADALKEAICYKQRMYDRDVLNNPYPSVLPKIRPNARRRTKSQVEADEINRKKLEQRKQTLGDVFIGDAPPLPAPPAAAPLSEVNLNSTTLNSLQHNYGFTSVAQNEKSHQPSTVPAVIGSSAGMATNPSDQSAAR